LSVKIRYGPPQGEIEGTMILRKKKASFAALTWAHVFFLVCVIHGMQGQQAPTTTAGQDAPADEWEGYRPESLSNGVQIKKPGLQDVIAMKDALPSKAPAVPKRSRRVLVFARARGYVHSAIPLAAATVEALGVKTGAWSTDITYDAADINDANLKRYDLVFLDGTTGAFLDDENDPAATAARKEALLNFVRGGKGLAAIHSSADSYHTGMCCALGKDLHTPESEQRHPEGTWPDFNKMLGGIFDWHFPFPQIVTLKIDDPKSPLTAMFQGKEFQVHDEIYTYAHFSLKNVHELTSIDYSKMSAADKAKEPEDIRGTTDYPLSWIRREGEGRVFYTALGHSEHIYAMPVILEQLLAGIQYALGDLPANDSPTQR
jgi:type 1 glutamine amidotransferase